MGEGRAAEELSACKWVFLKFYFSFRDPRAQRCRGRVGCQVDAIHKNTADCGALSLAVRVELQRLVTAHRKPGEEKKLAQLEIPDKGP